MNCVFIGPKVSFISEISSSMGLKSGLYGDNTPVHPDSPATPPLHLRDKL